MRHPNSGLPEFGNIIVQVGNTDLDAQARNPYSRSWLWIPGSLAQRKIDARINFAARLAPRNDGVVDRITAN